MAGSMGAFKDEVLFKWLQEKNPKVDDLKQAIEYVLVLSLPSFYAFFAISCFFKFYLIFVLTSNFTAVHVVVRRLLCCDVRIGHRRSPQRQHHGSGGRPPVPHRLWTHLRQL